MSFNFLGANFVVPKSGHKQPALGRALECTAKIKMKNTLPKKLVRHSYQIFYFLLCYILVFTSADIIFHKFSEFHSTLSEKKNFFFNRFTQNTPHPFNGQNLLIMKKIFCQCTLNFFGNQTSNAHDGIKYMII